MTYSFVRPRVLALGLVVTIAGSLGWGPAPAAAAGGSTFVQVANGYRGDAGLGPVALNAVIDQIAVERGRQLAEDEALGHDLNYVKDRLEEAGICWTRVGEIVAYNTSGSISTFGDQWYDSSGHRAIMLGDFTHAGGSREFAGGRWWAVMVFVKVCGATTAPAFFDIAGSPYRVDIEWLVEEQITNGCTAALFCPGDPVTREQMATFIVRALGLPPASRDHFSDDNASPHEDAINRMADASLTDGCGPNRFCPRARISRAEMASFLDRALNLPPTGANPFWDDNGSPHEGAINRLAAAGLVFGCAEMRFCPTSPVSRGQMAAFLHRGFD